MVGDDRRSKIKREERERERKREGGNENG